MNKGIIVERVEIKDLDRCVDIMGSMHGDLSEMDYITQTIMFTSVIMSFSLLPFVAVILVCCPIVGGDRETSCLFL